MRVPVDRTKTQVYSSCRTTEQYKLALTRAGEAWPRLMLRQRSKHVFMQYLLNKSGSQSD